MSSTNSTLTLEGLPQPPQGANPFAFYEQALADSLIRTVDTGFIIRQSILCALLGYTLIVAGANVFVVVRDGRKRGKKFFLWRLLARERGRYIVGKCVSSLPLSVEYVRPRVADGRVRQSPISRAVAHVLRDAFPHRPRRQRVGDDFRQRLFGLDGPVAPRAVDAALYTAVRHLEVPHPRAWAY